MSQAFNSDHLALADLLPRLPRHTDTEADREEFGEPTPEGLARLLLAPIRTRDTVIPDWVSGVWLVAVACLVMVLVFQAARRYEAAAWERAQGAVVTVRSVQR